MLHFMHLSEVGANAGLLLERRGLIRSKGTLHWPNEVLASESDRPMRDQATEAPLSSNSTD